MRPRRKPWIAFVRACGFVLFSPLLLLALLEGLPGSPKAYRKDKARWTERRRRRELAPQQGLDRVFDGDWQGAAGRLLLDWYGQAPDAERLLVVHAGRSRILLLAAPWLLWNPGPARKLRVVTEIPPGTARLEVPELSGPDIPFFRIWCADGSWLGMRFVESEDAAASALKACRRLSDAL